MNQYEIYEATKDLQSTGSIDNPPVFGLTFAKTGDHLKKLIDYPFEVHVLVPYDISDFIIDMLPKHIQVYKLNKEYDLKTVFILIHNKINYFNNPEPNLISSKAIIHPTAILDVPGNNIVKMSDGRIINMKHMGNVVVEEYAEVQAYSVVHRSVFTSTIIRKNTQIFAKVNVGHNCDIGESTIVCPGSLLAGGTKVGKNCYIWQGVITRSHVTICDNVIIGAGSLVLKDIDKPGVYVGTPAKYIKEYDEVLR